MRTRPERVLVSEEGRERKLEGIINPGASPGAQDLLYPKIGPHEILSMSTTGLQFRENESVGIDFDERNLFVFNKASGKRIKLSHRNSRQFNASETEDSPEISG